MQHGGGLLILQHNQVLTLIYAVAMHVEVWAVFCKLQN
jgi:hypothetical protein